MYTQLECIQYSTASLGTDATDRILRDRFPGWLSMGNTCRSMSLQTSIKYKTLERNGSFAEMIAQLRPKYDEDVNTLFGRMPTTLYGVDAMSDEAEWRSRTQSEDDLWAQFCRKTRDFMGKSTVLLGKVGVVSAQIMLHRDGPPAADDMIHRIYREIGDRVGNHDADALREGH